MIIVANPAAGGGTAPRKMERIETELRRRGERFTVAFTRSYGEVCALVATTFAGGEREFVAAGGDGCVNAVASAIMTVLPASDHALVALGAIGLGSSNDFHKPLSPARTVDGIPLMIDFPSARFRDLIGLTTLKNSTIRQHYFLINASVGLTAEANRFFNTPDALLGLLKRTSTGGAILYAAVRTLLIFGNHALAIAIPGTGRIETRLTNLAILKSPHVSGGLQFPHGESYDSGFVQVHLAANLHRVGRFRLFRDLAAHRTPEGRTMRTWRAQEVILSSDTPFAVEFDGEVLTAERVHFSVLPQRLRVCTC